MKKLGLYAVPLIAVFLLSSCGGSKEPTKVFYTLTYTYDNGSTDKYVEIYDEYKKTEKPTWQPTYFNHTFDGWFTKSGKEGTQFTFGNVLTENTVVYAHWTENPAPDVYCTISFDTDGGTSVNAQTIKVGEQIDSSPITAKTGWDFDGWYDGESKVTFPYAVNATKTLKARWVDGDNIHTVTFHPENGESTFAGEVRNGSTLAAPAVPAYVDHKFEGWFTAQTGGTEFDFSTVFTSETEITDLYAHWTSDPTPDVYYTISFDTDGGTSVDAKTVKANEEITSSPTTTKTGWDFDGWYDGENEVTFPYTVSATKTLKAHWANGDNIHTITFHPENDDNTFTGEVRNGSTLAAPAVPIYANHKFDGWFTEATGGTQFDFSTVFTSETEITDLYAHWTSDPTPDVYYTISFDTDGGTSVDAKTVKANEEITTAPTTTKTGWDFDGWFDGENEVTFPYTVSATKTLKAHWANGDNIHTITFHPENGGNTFTGEVRNGSTLAAPAVPTYVDHKFEGWFTAQTGGTQFDFLTVFTSETEITDLYAHWDVAIPGSYNYIIFRKDSEKDIVRIVTPNYLSFTAPTFTPSQYHDGKWYCAELGTGTSLESGESFTLTSGNLNDYTFVYQETETEYTITFEKEGEQDVTHTVKLSNPSFTTPAFVPPTFYNGWWVCDDWLDGSVMKLGSETPCTLDIDQGELGNHTFIYANEVIEYDVKFFKTDGQTLVDSQKITAESLTITAPTHDVSEYYDSGVWKDGNIEIASGAEYTFTNEQIGEHNFTWTETPHQYKVTFKYADGTTASVEKFISANNLTVEAPETKMAAPLSGRVVWKTSDNVIIESNGTRTFDKSELKEYVFNETQEEGFSITYVLGDKATVNPTSNPKSYKVDETVTLTDPTLEGFIFNGWYLTNDEHNKFEYQDGWTAGQMTGNITLYADWCEKDKTLDDYSWLEINDISFNGEASKYFDIGDTKSLNVNGNDYHARIIDFNFDKLSTSSGDGRQYAGITFEFAETIKGSTYTWNNKDKADSKNYDFINRSDLNDCLQPYGSIYEMMSKIPGLMTVVKEVVKSVETTSSYTSTDYNTKLFTYSKDEIDGNDDGTYEYYKTDSQNKRKKDNYYNYYWLRTPCENDSAKAWNIDRDGNLNSTNFSEVFRGWNVAPVFCI